MVAARRCRFTSCKPYSGLPSTPVTGSRHSSGDLYEMAPRSRAREAPTAIAFKLPHLARVPLTGVDGNPEYGLPLVRRKRLAATIVMPPAAGKAVELVHETWTNPKFAPPALVELPVHSYPELSQLAPRAPA